VIANRCPLSTHTPWRGARSANASTRADVQPDGSRALVVGELDKVPEAAGGLALRIVVTGAR